MRPFRANYRYLPGIVIIALLLLVLAACGDSGLSTTPVANDQPTATVAAPVEDTPTPTDTPAPVEPTIALPPDPTAPPTPSGLDETQQATIYSVVARDLLQQSEGGTIPDFVGVSPQAGIGELLDTSASGVTITDQLIDMLGDLGTNVAFVDFAQAIGPLDEGGQVNDDGVYLTFGTMREDPASGGYQLYASFYHANDDAAGFSYVVARDNGAWIIKDRTEVWRR